MFHITTCTCCSKPNRRFELSRHDLCKGQFLSITRKGSSLGCSPFFLYLSIKRFTRTSSMAWFQDFELSPSRCLRTCNVNQSRTLYQPMSHAQFTVKPLLDLKRKLKNKVFLCFLQVWIRKRSIQNHNLSVIMPGFTQLNCSVIL